MTTVTHRLPNGTVPVLLSGSTADLVPAEATALLGYATTHPQVTPQAIADMLFRTRIARPHRALAMVTDRDELLSACAAIADGRDHPQVVRTATPAAVRRVGYVFPGQGGQRPGMGRLFYRSIPAFRAEADRCAQAFQAETGATPLDYLLDDDLTGDDSASVVQPALFTQMAGLAAMWRSFGVEPAAAVGHSQGEIAAGYVTGVITLADAVRVVAIRAGAVDQLLDGDYAMAVAAADRDTCERELARHPGWAELSVVNSPGISGFSGERTTVRAVVDTLTERGVFARLIPVRYPAHTSLINRVGDRVRAQTRRRLQHPTFLDTDIGCLGGTLGGPITPDLPVDQYWFLNLRNTVRFDQAVSAAVSLGVDTFVELAAHPTLQLALEENLTAAGDRASLVLGTSHRTANDLDDFTRNLALAAIHDLDYPWRRLGTEVDGPPPLPLTDFPNTRMSQVTLWLPYTGADGAPGTSSPAPMAEGPAAATAPPRLLVERWVRPARRALVAPRAIGVIDHTGHCAGLADALREAAAAIGATARPLDPGQCPGAAAGLDGYVILVPPSPERDVAAAAEAVSAFFSRRDWWPGFTAGADCWLVTSGGEAVIAADPAPDPVHAALAAGFRAIGAESPGNRVRHLDLPAGAPPEDLAAAVISALHTADEPELAWRDGALYAKRIIEDVPSAAAATAPEHVLILGGTGNLGLEFCEHFARRGARRITLVSRSGETAAVAARLHQIRSATAARIDAAVCDIADRAAVTQLAEQHRDAPADLIIHAALTYSDADLADITAAHADQVLRAKAVGIGRVLEAFPRTGDCKVVLCSSAAATIGGRGQVVYAAANRMLDAIARRLRTDGLDCVAVQWGQWTVHFDLDLAGWAKLAATGLLPMRPADALAVDITGLDHNAIVAAFDLVRARPVLSAYGYGPLLSELTTPDPPAPGPAASSVGAGDPRQRLLGLLADAIGVDGVDAIDPATPMVAIGLDSLQALEFRRRVKTEFDHDLAVSDLLGGASISDVLQRLGAESG